MIRLGLRLVFSCGREAAARLLLLVLAVGLGTGLLLTALSGINAVNSQNSRYGWLDTAAAHQKPNGRDPLWGMVTADSFDGQAITRVDVAATGPTSPVPPGIPKLPGPGQYYASPALASLFASTPGGELAARYPGQQAGLIGDAALPSPGSLIIVVGHAAAQLSRVESAGEVWSINTTPPSSCTGSGCQATMGTQSRAIDLVLSVVTLALLFPVLIFIATATRLSAARREQRFAAMRLTGAAPRQISLVAAVESAVAAVAGAAAGFGIFFALRIPLAAVPFTGQPFFPGDLSLNVLDLVLTVLGIPLAAVIAARIALHRVHISPLGVTRRVTPAPPRAWRALPLLAGLADLAYYAAAGSPPSIPGQILAYVPGFALIVAGLVLIGPWLTRIGAAALTRRTSRPAALIAARRLADDPKAGFRAVSGLVLALFVTTVAVAVITTIDAERGAPPPGQSFSATLLDQFTTEKAGEPPAPSAGTLAALNAVSGVHGTAVIHPDTAGITVPAALTGKPAGSPPLQPGLVGLVSCAQLARVPALGRCPAGAQAVALPDLGGLIATATTQQTTWPAAPVSAAQLQNLPASAVAVATSGSAQAVERARTALELDYPYRDTPATFGEIDKSLPSARTDLAYQQLADVVVLLSLPIAGCTLAASVAAGLADRKRPFSMLRLTGGSLAMLRRVVMLETAVPLLAVAALSIGTGFLAAALFTKSQLSYTLAPPQATYYLLTGAGIAVSLGIIAVTFPLLARITGPEVARNE
ncbi:MAG: FtsX-like permease family protein [Trebonia sp.]